VSTGVGKLYPNAYFISKSSGTYADALAAYGIAVILHEVLRRTRHTKSYSMHIADMGAYYQVSYAGKLLTPEEIETCPFFETPGAYYITGGSEKKAEPPPGVDLFEGVDATWDKVKNFATRRTLLREQGLRGTDLEQQLKNEEPPAYWPLVTWIGDYRMQAQGIHNKLLHKWVESEEHFHANLKAIFQLCATLETDMEAIATTWGKETGHTSKGQRTITSSQLFNPHQGKGLNQPKANSLKMDNIKDNFWLWEYVKVCGLWACAVPRQTPDGERKTYVLSPHLMKMANHSEVFNRFSRRLWLQSERHTTSLKLDITSLLLYLDQLLECSEAGQLDEEEDEPYQPEQVVNGMYVVQFSRLSQHAYTMTHIGFLGLPRWAENVRNRIEVYALKPVIREHLRLIQGVDEKRSDGYELLRRYRNFVAGGQWDAFLEFTMGYSNYLMREMHAGKTPWLFSVEKLRRLVMSAAKEDNSLLEIIENEGFLRIAYAIRHSTIIPQGQMARYKQGKGEKPVYDIRYGLGQSLKQKANSKLEFLDALGDFLSTYSAETYQVYETKGVRRRGDVRVSNLNEITRLVEQFGPSVICKWLVAYGYASDFTDTQSTHENESRDGEANES
jgi:hypothetical protein